jgi:3,5-epimerase/4-reductase
MTTVEVKVLVFGANGWIGSKVYALLNDMIGVTVRKAECRADNYAEVDTEITNFKPTHVMSFIGRTHGVINGEVIGTIDYLEQPGKLVENMRDNLYGPLIISEVCKLHKCHFTYLGTGCIFEYDEEHVFGNENNGFVEKDKPNFYGSSYSIVKGFTDRLMHELYNNSVLNVRIRMPITDEINPRNFITKITNYKRVCSVPNSMTVLNELLPHMINLALRNIVGTVNLTNPGLITHNEMLDMYKEIIDPTFSWENFSISEQNEILSSKRSNNCLNVDYLITECPTIKPIKESVRDILIEMKKNITNNI